MLHLALGELNLAAIVQELRVVNFARQTVQRHDGPLRQTQQLFDGHPRTAQFDGQLDRNIHNQVDILQRPADITTAKLLEHRVGSAFATG